MPIANKGEQKQIPLPTWATVYEKVFCGSLVLLMLSLLLEYKKHLRSRRTLNAGRYNWFVAVSCCAKCVQAQPAVARRFIAVLL